MRSVIPFPASAKMSPKSSPSLMRSVMNFTMPPSSFASPRSPLVAFPLMSVTWKFSHAPESSSMSPFRLSRIAAALPAAVKRVMASAMSLKPSAPFSDRMIAPRIASEPNSVLSFACRCSAVRPFSASCRMPATSAIDFMLPFASKNLFFPSAVMSPSRLNSSAAWSVLGTRRESIVLSDVPASEPRSPFFAKSASAALVSSKETPMPAATDAQADMA